jgi:hypothetical protein
MGLQHRLPHRAQALARMAEMCSTGANFRKASRLSIERCSIWRW